MSFSIMFYQDVVYYWADEFQDLIFFSYLAMKTDFAYINNFHAAKQDLTIFVDTT